MGIRFQCDQCQASLNVKAELGGKKGKCPKCGAKITVPVASEPRSERASSPATPKSSAGATSSPHPGAGLTMTPAQAESLLTQAAGATATQVETGVVDKPASNQKSDGEQGSPQNNSPPASPESAQPATESSSVESHPLPETDAWTESPADGEQLVASIVEDESLDQTTEQQLQNSGESQEYPPGSIDPIREEPDAIWYVSPPGGGKYGPAESDVMRRWLDEGRVAANSLVWREGWAEWQVASGIFPELGSPQPPSKAPQLGETASSSDEQPTNQVPPSNAPSHLSPNQPLPPQTMPTSGGQPSAAAGAGATQAENPQPQPSAPSGQPDRSSHHVLAYRQKRQRNQVLAVLGIVFLSVMIVGLSVVLAIIVLQNGS